MRPAGFLHNERIETASIWTFKAKDTVEAKSVITSLWAMDPAGGIRVLKNAELLQELCDFKQLRSKYIFSADVRYKYSH
jgi:hypothetical protein